MADRIVVLNKGVVAQQGAPMSLYHQPENEFVATFIGSPKMNVIPVTMTRPHAGKVHLENRMGLSLDLADANGALPQGEAKLGIRPEHLKIAFEGTGNFAAEVVIVERLGVETYMTVGSPQAPIVVRAEGDIAVRPGDRVSLAADPSTCHLFDSTGRVIRPAQAS
jgi:multiple sugar transport system ATP-binding protein